MFKQCKFRDDENDGVIHGGLYDEDEGILICGCCGGIINEDEIYFPQEDYDNEGYDYDNHTHTMIEIYDTWVNLSETITGDDFRPQPATYESHIEVPGYTRNIKESELSNRVGEDVDVLRILTDEDIDIDNLGPMYLIRFDDGVEIEAFQDELNFIPPSLRG